MGSTVDVTPSRLPVIVEWALQVTTLFVTSDFGILMQDSFQLEEPLEALLGLQVPTILQCTRKHMGTIVHT